MKKKIILLTLISLGALSLTYAQDETPLIDLTSPAYAGRSASVNLPGPSSSYQPNLYTSQNQPALAQVPQQQPLVQSAQLNPVPNQASATVQPYGRKLRIFLRELAILQQAARSLGGDLQISITPIGITAAQLAEPLAKMGWFDVYPEDNVIVVRSKTVDPAVDQIKQQVAELETRRRQLLDDIKTLEQIALEKRSQPTYAYPPMPNYANTPYQPLPPRPIQSVQQPVYTYQQQNVPVIGEPLRVVRPSLSQQIPAPRIQPTQEVESNISPAFNSKGRYSAQIMLNPVPAQPVEATQNVTQPSQYTVVNPPSSNQHYPQPSYPRSYYQQSSYQQQQQPQPVPSTPWQLNTGNDQSNASYQPATQNAPTSTLAQNQSSHLNSFSTVTLTPQAN